MSTRTTTTTTAGDADGADGAAPAHQPGGRIRIPWRVRWFRFRSQMVPVLTLLLCIGLTAALWQRRYAVGNAVGAVEVVRNSVVSDVDGVLAPVPGAQIEPFTKVKQGDLLARMDDGPFRRQRAAKAVELEQLNTQLRALRAKPGVQPNEIDAMVDTVTAKEEEIAAIDLKLQALEIRAPVTGTVNRVYRRPGQLVRVGEPIMDMASDSGAFIVSFLRQDQRIVPTAGMPVEIRPVSNPTAVFHSRVAQVGGNLELIPSQQLRDQKIEEWGLPIRVTVPPEAQLRPGELVHLVFPDAAGAIAGAPAGSAAATVAE